ncbi:hypothetical protein BO71DRAFT_398468 [Aspergillus ellipticus CBS 707.79]|uniref:Uncharacterized protein n=1 Tax=Aspergillus ellipticus CBS 707.79 TaxID=1448320 RepID=A0A319DC65_9EURO|nr:hypothetical protein BO71DRAFT_398468 [Aspergillus ellipticus CBS 707.79]
MFPLVTAFSLEIGNSDVFFLPFANIYPMLFMLFGSAPKLNVYSRPQSMIRWTMLAYENYNTRQPNISR